MIVVDQFLLYGWRRKGFARPALFLYTYLPQQLTEEELILYIQQAIEKTNASSIKDMGKVMGMLRPQIIGKADMKHTADLIKNKLQS